jgi:hypothetical protein
MEQDAAASNLQFIRALMERSAVYQRALAPIMLYVGSVGTLASLAGVALGIEGVRQFCAWWLATAAVALSGAFLIAHRQAQGDHEPFWSPPALRATQAIAPPLAAGLLLSVTLVVYAPGHPLWLFVLANALFYGCAAHAAGFFVARATRVFGWLIIALAGAALLSVPAAQGTPDFRVNHALMGGLFGLLHLCFAVYLYATERKTAS